MYKHYLLYTLLITILISCSKNNELEGKWKIVDNERDFVINFKDGEVYNTLFENLKNDSSRVLYSKSKKNEDLYFIATNTKHPKYIEKVWYTIKNDILRTFSDNVLYDSIVKKEKSIYIRVK